ncbi:MAG: hypothetical protein NVS3B21_33650 [Acidimicrobiales bacterium]
MANVRADTDRKAPEHLPVDLLGSATIDVAVGFRPDDTFGRARHVGDRGGGD